MRSASGIGPKGQLVSDNEWAYAASTQPIVNELEPQATHSCVRGSAATALIAGSAGTFAADKAPSELQLRTAEYVHRFVNQLSFLVADEQLQFRDGKKVTSEFLVIRDPGTLTALLTVRDIRVLNGTPVEGNTERLLEILQKPIDNALDRAKQLRAVSRQHVPDSFNPLFAIAFLQADYIPRFKVDERDASREFPRNTKMLAFQETAKPTLFRTGTYNELDVTDKGHGVGRARYGPRPADRASDSRRLAGDEGHHPVRPGRRAADAPADAHDRRETGCVGDLHELPALPRERAGDAADAAGAADPESAVTAA